MCQRLCNRSSSNLLDRRQGTGFQLGLCDPSFTQDCLKGTHLLIREAARCCDPVLGGSRARPRRKPDEIPPACGPKHENLHASRQWRHNYEAGSAVTSNAPQSAVHGSPKVGTRVRQGPQLLPCGGRLCPDLPSLIDLETEQGPMAFCCKYGQQLCTQNRGAQRVSTSRQPSWVTLKEQSGNRWGWDASMRLTGLQADLLQH